MRDEVLMDIRLKGLTDTVHWLGFVPNSAPILARMSAMIMTSDHEGLPMAVLEALCLDVPVVSHSVGAIPEVLDHGRFGKLVPSQDPARYADAIEEVVAEASRRTERSTEASAHIARSFSAASMANEYLNLYQRITGNS